MYFLATATMMCQLAITPSISINWYWFFFLTSFFDVTIQQAPDWCWIIKKVNISRNAKWKLFKCENIYWFFYGNFKDAPTRQIFSIHWAISLAYIALKRVWWLFRSTGGKHCSKVSGSQRCNMLNHVCYLSFLGMCMTAYFQAS